MTNIIPEAHIVDLKNLVASTNLKSDMRIVMIGGNCQTAQLFKGDDKVSQVNSHDPQFMGIVYGWLATYAAGYLPEPAPQEVTYDSLLCDARDELKDAIRELNATYYDDNGICERLHEIVDSNVPFINHEIFEVFTNGGISHEMDDNGLIHGCSDVIKILQMRIYEELSNDLYGELEDLIQEYNDELEDEAETCGYGDDGEEEDDE